MSASNFHTLNQEPIESGDQPIRARYLGYVTGNQPITNQYFLIRSVLDTIPPLQEQYQQNVVTLTSQIEDLTKSKTELETKIQDLEKGGTVYLSDLRNIRQPPILHLRPTGNCT